MPDSIASLSRKSRERVADAPESAPAPEHVSPYADATEPCLIPGTSKVALVVRDTRSDALYVSTRNVSGNGRAARVHMDAIATLGFVHAEDAETLAECPAVQKLIADAVAQATPPAPKPAKKASGSK